MYNIIQLLDVSFEPSGKTWQRQKLGKGPENIASEKIGKTRQTLKNT